MNKNFKITDEVCMILFDLKVKNSYCIIAEIFTIQILNEYRISVSVRKLSTYP